MTNKFARRDLFQFAGGGALGMLLTPAPWRLITDTALWSQNWGWIPRPAHGETSFQFTNCALCPAGCGLRVRSVGGQPVAIAGAANDPAGRGTLCPFGLTGHHLPYHPARLKQALHRGKPVKAEEALAAVTAAVEDARKSGAAVAVLDLRPGRTASWIYRRSLATLPNASYIVPAEAEGATFRAIDAALAPDFEKAAMVLSFGTPLADAWGTPGRFLHARDKFVLVQIEPVESRSASMADLWLPVAPGGEAALALALAGELIRTGVHERGAERFSGFREFAQMATAAPAGQRERDLARQLAEKRPALVIADPDPSAGPFQPAERHAFAALQTLLGFGAFASRRELPAPAAWKDAAAPKTPANVADGSLRLLFVDESTPGAAVPWKLVQNKLARENALIVSFTCAPGGYSRYADYVLPTAVFPEVMQDLPAAADSPVAGYRVAAALAPPPAGMVEPAGFVAAATGQSIDLAAATRERASAIHASGRGSLVSYGDGTAAPVRTVEPDKFWKALETGACWLDEPAAAPAVKFAFQAHDAKPPATGVETDLPLIALAATWRGAPGGPTSPMMSKLWQESDLRPAANTAALHPQTAREAGVADGARALLQTRCGRCEVRVAVDAGVMPGVVQVAAGAALDVCGPDSGGDWRLTRAKVVRI